MISLWQNAEQRTLLFLGISLVTLVVSFFDVAHLPVNAAWIAILLCGVPIVKGAIAGLVREFDVKADVLVSLALIAAVMIGETFAAGEIA
ncbi:MAG: cation-transporting P-type ATPase, partial [Peptococcaceae bacterium]|nr:cation-transporting P-type ATPase [Peptococcaceae bacterium]